MRFVRSPIPTVIIDTREQERHRSQYSFASLSSVRRKLRFGDYSICGEIDGLFVSLENLFAPERKTLQDGCSTFSTHHDRFLLEVERSQLRGAAMPVVFEGTRRDIELKRYMGANPPQSVLGMIESLATRGIPVLFAGDQSPNDEQLERIARATNDRSRWLVQLEVYREQGRDMVERLLRYAWRHEVEKIRAAAKVTSAAM